jgi:hypothetical protein
MYGSSYTVLVIFYKRYMLVSQFNMANMKIVKRCLHVYGHHLEEEGKAKIW